MAALSPAQKHMRVVVSKRIKLSRPLLERAGYSVDAFERIMLNTLIHFPKIADCDDDSVEEALMHCITQGLIPDGREAAIVPAGSKASYRPMIGGRRKLARQATPGLYLHDQVIYEADDWTHEEGLSPRLEHHPNRNAQRTDDQIVAAYAVAQVPGAPRAEFEFLYMDQLIRLRSRSVAYTKGQEGRRGPWETDFAEMCRKSAMGQVLKRLPQMPGTPEPDSTDMNYEGMMDSSAPAPGSVMTSTVNESAVVDTEATETEPEPEADKPATQRKSRSKASTNPQPEKDPEPAVEGSGGAGTDDSDVPPPETLEAKADSTDDTEPRKPLF